MKATVVEILSERPSTFKPELMYQTVKLSTHVGYVEKEFFNKNLSIGNGVNITIQHLTTRFSNRLKKLGIETELIANYPWIYLRSVNGVKVKEIFAAEHGFTAFFDGSKGCKFSDRKKVFKLIRDYVRHEE
ncbi:hypothetical protein VP14_186 [Vibrio phage VPMCC14]|nr:hypothetical protein VP14_186 [Vibrio phage VPMCC14]